MQCQIVSVLFQTLRSLLEAEKQPRDYGTGPLYRSELALLERVRRSPGINAAELSRGLRVTRPAITQMGGRLEEKGLIERFSKPENKKEKYYRLTELGEATWQAHAAHHAAANQEMCAFLRGLDDGEKQVILQFLTKAGEALPISNFDCTCQDTQDACGKIKESTTCWN